MIQHETRSSSIVYPSTLRKYPEIVMAVSAREGRISTEPFGFNMSLSVGDMEANVHANRERFFQQLGFGSNRVAFQRQVHGDNIQVINQPGIYDSTDGLITSEPNVFLAVSIADCLPILLYDPRNKIVAGIHSGWKGSALRIALRAISMMTSRFGTQSKDVIAYLGPSAGGCCYEVGEEVASQFPSECVDRSKGVRPYLDIKKFNQNLLVSAGVLQDSIEVSPYCTICSEEIRFHSYRRDRGRSGRMFAVVGMKGGTREGLIP